MQYLMNFRLNMTLNGAIDASVRFVLGVVLCLFELFSHLALRNAPQNESFYLRAIFVALLLYGLFMRFGNSDLVRDLREICLYDVLVQIFGLLWFALGNLSFVTQILAGTVLVLKVVRLFWPAAMPDGGRWPVFGVLGWLRRHQSPPLPGGQNRQVYLVLAVAPLLGYLVSVIDKLGLLAALAAVPVLYMMVYASHFLATFNQIGTRLSKLSSERDTALAELQSLRQQSLAGAAIGPEQAALLKAYFRIDPSLRMNLVPMLEQFAERFPMPEAGAAKEPGQMRGQIRGPVAGHQPENRAGSESGRVGSGPD